MSAATQEDKLLRMANQIAAFFRSYPEEEAVAGIHKHITAFWTPRMVSKLEAALPGFGERADILVRRAMTGPEPAGEGPVRPATRDPQKLGEGASDAG
ncbi:formate dehydrogenase subunit delta [Methylobacterium sp. NEAU 140]|uniref:formate dehydrogenase subunit delta n=1 Tax=Methylobacterium sp. NEAU 140 TaxID=3064945 RepID=UPI002737299E|nr:formate dehydrogenase subunit delta [Methylobacterium sp. NEAU 140]MDP4021385.1 formate dehydrogenase subunit delta [Methylobacterium sp. NEAU 140]